MESAPESPPAQEQECQHEDVEHPRPATAIQAAPEPSSSAPAAKASGVTAFFVFSNEHRDAVRKSLQSEAGDGAKVTIGAVAKKIGEMWKALTADEKARYKSIATENRAARPAAAEVAAPEGDDGAALEEGPAALPLSTVKKIIMLDKDQTRISADAVKAVALAAQLFLEALAPRAADEAKGSGRKGISFRDVETAMRRWKVLAWPESPFLEIENQSRTVAAVPGAKALQQAAEKTTSIESFFAVRSKPAAEAAKDAA